MTSATLIIVLCPCCEVTFPSPMLMSTNTFGGQSTDFHSRAVGDDPLWYVLGTCPTCGFTDYTNKLERGVRLTEATKAKIWDEIAPQMQNHRPDVATQFVMAAQIAIWEHQDASVIGNHFLRAAWCSRDQAQEVEYRRLACRYFEQALAEERLSDKVWLNYTYLVGELYRRMGERQMARVWFDKAIAFAESVDDPYADQLAALARDQRDHPREKI